MAQQPKKRKRKVKRKVRITQKARIQKKDSVSNDTLGRDTLPRIQGRPPADVAPTFRIKIRKKR
jgi:hypothetical protein